MISRFFVVFFLLAVAASDKSFVPDKRQNEDKDPVGKVQRYADPSRGFEELMQQMGRMDAKLDKLNLIEAKLDRVETLVVEASEILQKWKESGSDNSDPSNYWMESRGCGGIATSRTGKITGFTNKSTLSECLWAIHPPHAHSIKMQLHRWIEDYYSTEKAKQEMGDCVVQEVQSNFTSSKQPVSFRPTRIFETRSYLFRNPLLLLRCTCLGLQSHKNYQYLNFEGSGFDMYPRVMFQNFHRDSARGTFDLITELSMNETDADFKNKDVLFATLAIRGADWASSATLKDFYVDRLGLNFCNYSSLSLHFNFSLMVSSPTVVDCCDVDCTKLQFLVEETYLLVTMNINVTAMFERTTSEYLRMSWKPHENSELVPPTSYGLERSCGGVISGRRTGTIRIMYVANQRCVWTIYPVGRNQILVHMGSSRIESGHDHLTFIEIKDDGSLNATTIEPGTLGGMRFQGRMFLVIFYSDHSKETSTELNLYWSVVGDMEPSLLNRSDKAYRYSNRTGNVDWKLSANESNVWAGFHVFVINPRTLYQAAHSLELNLTYEFYGPTKMALYSFKNSSLTKASNTTYLENGTTFDDQNYTSFDGFFVLVVEPLRENTEIVINMEWKQGVSTTPTILHGCGGFAEGHEHGSILYSAVFGSNRLQCTWLINTPCSQVTFEISKSYLDEEESNIHVLIHRIDLNRGVINEDSPIHLELLRNRTVVAEGPLVLVTLKIRSNSRSAYASMTIRTKKLVDINYKCNAHSPLSADLPSFRVLDLGNMGSRGNVSYSRMEDTSGDTVVMYTNVNMTDYAIQIGSTILTSPLFGADFTFSLYAINSERSLGTNSTCKLMAECIFDTGDVEDDCHNLNNETIHVTLNSGGRNYYGVQLAKVNGFLAIVKPGLDSDVPHEESMPNNNATLDLLLHWHNDKQCGGIVRKKNGSIMDNWTSHMGHFCMGLIDASNFGVASLTFSSRMAQETPGIFVRGLNPDSGLLEKAFTLRRGGVLEVISPLALVYFQSYYPLEKLSFVSSTSNRSTISPIFTQSINSNPASGSVTFPFTKGDKVGKNTTAVWLLQSSVDDVVYINLHSVTLFLDEQCDSDQLAFYYILRTSYHYYNPDSLVLNKLLKAKRFGNCSNSEETTTYDDGQDYKEYYDTATTPGNTNSDEIQCQVECYETQVVGSNEPALRLKLPAVIIYKSRSRVEEGKEIRFSWTFMQE